jgi:hypothetical protein
VSHLVRLRPEYTDPGETELLHEVVEDSGERVAIRPVEWPWPIKPIEVVGREMVEEVLCERKS